MMLDLDPPGFKIDARDIVNKERTMRIAHARRRRRALDWQMQGVDILGQGYAAPAKLGMTHVHRDEPVRPALRVQPTAPLDVDSERRHVPRSHLVVGNAARCVTASGRLGSVGVQEGQVQVRLV